MKHIFLTFTFYLSLVISLFLQKEVSVNNSNTSSEMMMCSPACQVLDSLILVDIFNLTSTAACPSPGPTGWDSNDWVFTDPVCSWPGVILNNDGFVISLVRNNHGLTGTIPVEIANLSQLEVLFLSNNCLTGSIPPELGQLSNLTSLFLDGNELSGSLPDELCDLTSLNSIFMDENNLSGTIPECFNELDQLLRFDIYKNCIDSIPDLSGMLSMQPGKFHVYDNKLTFDDILPNLYGIGTFYEPQDSFCVDVTVELTTGETYLLDLGIDAGLSDNAYQWYKDGSLFGAPTNSNTLVFDPVTFDVVGTYHCRVTNPNAPDLTLQSRCKTIEVACGTSVFDFTADVCDGYEIEINGTTYDIDNPCDNTTLSGMDQFGCDSVINVCLNFVTPTPYTIDTTLCSGESIFVNGTEYDVNLTSGLESIGMPDQFNCDSTIQVNVSFFPPAVFNFEPTVCLNDTLMVGGQEFHFTDSSGQIILPGDSFNGCDSIINIDLNFWSEASNLIEGSYCDGQEITINGTVYNTANPDGTDTLFNANWSGCDSIIIVDLTFGAGVENTIDDLVCQGQSIVVNGTSYDCDNPTGTETISGGSISNCDSTIIVNLTCFQSPNGMIDTMLCSGDSLIYNGTTYDGLNPDGEENLGSIGFNGCDSIVEIQVSYWPPAFSTIDTMLCANQSIIVNGSEISASAVINMPGESLNGCDSTIYVIIGVTPPSNYLIDTVLCPGSSIFVNGTEYNQDLLSGSEMIPEGSVNGCDSIVFIEITYANIIVNQIDQILCLGDSLVLPQVTLNEMNPTYTDTIIGGSVAGCDSVINISVTFHPESINNYSPTLCTNDTLFIGGFIFHEESPSGTVVLFGSNYNGCDSTINVAANFITTPTGNFSTTLCFGDSILINGTNYHAGNTSGTETINMGSINNCDSTFTVSIDFYPPAENTISTTLCDGESLDINGITLDINNSSDTITLTGTGFHGCDSTIIVNLDFYPPATHLINNTLCFGQSIIVNGTSYDETTPSGTEILTDSSFHGCDSIVTIDLSFNNAVEETLNPVFCDPAIELIVNGQTYNILTPSGIETMIAGSYTGCDSIVHVDLFYPDSAFVFYNNILCPGESITVNGNIYDEETPQGEEVIPGASLYGCDVYHIIDLGFHSISESYIDETLCFGTDTLINGILFDVNHTSDTIVLSGAAFTSCDSFVIINIDLLPEIAYQLDSALCAGQVVVVNGTEYNESLPFGIEEMESYTGCDSLVIINLSYNGAVINDINESICEGDSITINGVIYHMGNPTGMDTIPDGSLAGCDSVLNVFVSFIPSSYLTIDTILCPGESLLVNGSIYNFNNLNGIDTLFNENYLGCDSILNISVTYFPFSENIIDTILCSGSTFEWNSQSYNSAISFSDTIFAGSYTNCDSVIFINLDFHEVASSIYTPVICSGDSLIFHDSVFHENNTSGEILLDGASYLGCDSTIFIDLSFYDLASSVYSPVICTGDSLIFHGSIFHENNTSGEIVLENASAMGCDSTIQVSLSFHPLSESTEITTICEGDNLLWNGVSYDMTGTYLDTLTNQSHTGCDSIIKLNLTVLTALDFGLADAGTDLITCNESISLTGNLINGTTGMWTVVSGNAVINNSQNAETTVTNMSEGDLSFVWTLSALGCPNYDSDTIQISAATIPEALDDQYIAEEGATSVALNLLENDQLHSITDWYLSLLDLPTGELEDLGNGEYNFTPSEISAGSLVTFQYELCNEDCPENCDTALVSIQLQETINPDFPNTITANSDGINDYFVIPDIEGSSNNQFSNKELIIFNRWGDVVYQAKPYENNWSGKNQDGKELPQGTYYYVLRLDVGDGVIYRGDITILR